MALYNTCRFCKEFSRDDLVQYGVRHYAHHHCYLEAGKSLDDLPTWMAGQFPFRLLQEHGLLETVEKRIAAEKVRA